VTVTEWMWARWRERQGLWFLLIVVVICVIAIALAPAGGYWRWWPHGKPALFRLNDQLVLAIPPEYQKFWLQGDRVVRAPASPQAIPSVPEVSFSFFLPHYSGYTPRNFKRELDPDRVDVVALGAADAAEGETGASGYYPPNLLDRILEGGGDPHARETHGLRCYQPAGLSGDRWLCFGPLGEEPSRQIMLWVDLPPYEPSVREPMMQAVYFTPRYGGMKITWRAHATHLAAWHEIDTRIWGLISQWNVADSLAHEAE
jgi:hypothetical protein